MNTFTKIIVFGGVALLGIFLLVQLVPYGRNHSNPPVLSEPNWDSPETRALAERACFDCHSNETQWPWYSNVAPVSWLVVRDTMEGRDHLNFSEWGQGGEGEEAEEILEVIQSGEMPPAQYVLMHSQANLSAEEQQALIEGLSRTTGQSIRSSESAESEHEGDD